MGNSSQIPVSGHRTPRRRLGIVGDCGLDLTFVLGNAAGEKREPARTYRSVGGTGANAAAAAVRLGSEVRLASVVGTDPFGQSIRHSLRELGVDASLLRSVPGTTQIAVILISADGRQLIVDPGASYHLDGFTPYVFQGWPDIIYMTHAPATTVRLFAEAGGTPLVVALNEADIQDSRWHDALSEDVVAVANSALEPNLAKVARGPRIITHGSEGASITLDGQTLNFPAPQVEAVDATGAGDCLAGALCHFLAGGRSIEAALRLAVIAASLSTRGIGAHGALPTERSVLESAEEAGVEGV